MLKERLNIGDNFPGQTWKPKNIKEASYALRVAGDGMVVDGKVFSPGNGCPDPVIKINPGRTAILSTEELLCMPSDLVGRLGVRPDFASRALTGLMGIQVDPYYGKDSLDVRLYIKVANFGNEAVEVKPGDAVFNIEFSEVIAATKPYPPKRRTWDRLLEELVNQEHSDWTFVARVQTDLDKRAYELESQVSKDLTETRTQQQRELSGIRDNQQSVVLFAVFLVAITILN
jgi:deoxycytidine triphosphate deaminase